MYCGVLSSSDLKEEHLPPRRHFSVKCCPEPSLLITYAARPPYVLTQGVTVYIRSGVTHRP